MSSPPSPAARARQPTSKALYSRLSKNLSWLVGGTGATALFTMGALAFAARGLTIAEFGLLMLLQTAALTVRGIFGIGTQQPIIHLGSAALDDDDKLRMGRLIGFGLLLDVGSALLAGAFGSLIVLLLGEVTGISAANRGHALLFAGAMLFMGYLTANGLFRLLNRFGLMTFIQTGVTALLFAGAAFLYGTGAPFDSYAYLWAAYLAIGIQAQLCVALILMRRRGVRPRFDVALLSSKDRRLFRTYAWSTWGTNVVQTVRMHADSLLVGALVGVGAVGLYNVAKQLAGILRKLTDNYASAVFPEVARLALDRDLPSSTRLLKRLVGVAIGIGLVAVVGIVLAGQPALRLGFGPDFVEAQGALLLLTIAAAMQLVINTLAVYIQVYRNPAYLLWIYMVALAAFIPAAAAGSLAFGITGAAFGQIAFALAAIPMAAIQTRRAMGSQAAGTAA